MPEDDWSLTQHRQHGPREFEYAPVRALSPAEQERIPTAMQLLRDFSGRALIGPLTEALNELNELFADLPNVGPADFQRGPYRSKLNGLLSAALTAFTSLRATIEANTRTHALPLPGGGSAFDNFAKLYREHPSFRLVHMLRNLDQHRPPASVVLTISADLDPATGENRVRPVIDVPAVCAQCAEESTQDKHRRQWEECQQMWKEHSEPIDIRTVLAQAYQACQTVLAAHIREAEPWVLKEAEFIARLVAEVEPLGSAYASQSIRTEDGSQLSIKAIYLDPHVFGDVYATLNAARKILGQPPLDG